MKPGTALFVTVLVFAFTASCDQTDGSRSETATQESLAALARCLTQQGLVLYSSSTCAACRAQRQAFGPAFAFIIEIECHPHAENTQVERCLERKIQITPTWITEKDGQERKRLEGYQSVADLAAFAGCVFSMENMRFIHFST